jgi:hypothetical protein
MPRRQTLRQPPAKNSSRKNAWNQEQPRLPGNVASLGVREKRQRPRRGYQRNQTGALRAMLIKRKK